MATAAQAGADEAARLAAAMAAEQAAAAKAVQDLTERLEQSEARRAELEAGLAEARAELGGSQEAGSAARAELAELQSRLEAEVATAAQAGADGFFCAVTSPKVVSGTRVDFGPFCVEDSKDSNSAGVSNVLSQIFVFDEVLAGGSDAFSVSSSASEDMFELQEALAIERARASFLVSAAKQRMESAEWVCGGASCSSPRYGNSVSGSQLPCFSPPASVHRGALTCNGALLWNDFAGRDALSSLALELAECKDDVKAILDDTADIISRTESSFEIFRIPTRSATAKEQFCCAAAGQVEELKLRLAATEGSKESLEVKLRATGDLLASEQRAVASLREELVSFMLEIQSPAGDSDASPDRATSLHRRTALALQQMLHSDGRLESAGVSPKTHSDVLRRLSEVEEDNLRLRADLATELAQRALLRQMPAHRPAASKSPPANGHRSIAGDREPLPAAGAAASCPATASVATQTVLVDEDMGSEHSSTAHASHARSALVFSA